MRLLALFLATTVAATSALAAEGMFMHPADANKDQKISKAEWTAFKFPEAQFDKADKNRDRQVDRDEFLAWDAAGRGAKDTKPAP